MNAIHAKAVQESAMITKRQWLMMGKDEIAKIELNAILKTLIDRKIPFVLTGAHSFGGWTGEPRASKDVDFFVASGSNFSGAVKAISRLYPHLQIKSMGRLAAFFVPGERLSVIDVIFTGGSKLPWIYAPWIGVKDQGLKYRIPSLEAALASKYRAMKSPNREPANKM